jgi:site-specific DNA recombinase
MDETLSVALYARVSSQRQADETTIRSQIVALRQRIEQDALVIDEERCFRDEGYSGSVLLRPALERLRDLIHCGGIDRLYVHSPDRLARNYVHQMVLLEEFARQGVQVVFLNHDPQDKTAEGNLLLQMQGMIAEYERAKILERTRRGRRFAARQGKVSALSHAPYGYRYVSKSEGDGEARYDIALDEARWVRELFRWVGVEGLSLARVVDRLQEQGVTTSKGNARWDKATIRGILLNPAYTGTAKYGKTRLFPRTPGRRPKRGDPPTPRKDKVTRATTPAEQESIPVPALISGELFEAAAERLQENRCRYREQKQGAEFLLGGLLICDRCNSAYCGRRPRQAGTERRFVYYRCLGTDKYRHAGEPICANRGVSGVPLEAAVWADVRSLLQDPGRLQRELRRRLERPPDKESAAPQRKESIVKLQRRLARLLDAYENGWLEKGDFESRMGRAKERLEREQEACARYEREVADANELRIVAERFEAFAEQIATGLDHADFETKRKLIRLLVKQIGVGEDEIRIVYKVQSRPFVLGPVRGNVHDWLKLHSIAQGASALGNKR